VTKGSTTDFFDHVLGYGWAVLSTAGAPTDVLSADNLAWAEENGVILTSLGEGSEVGDADGNYAAWLQELDADTVIVRPDFYIYDAGALGGLDAAVTELRGKLYATASGTV